VIRFIFSSNIASTLTSSGDACCCGSVRNLAPIWSPSWEVLPSPSQIIPVRSLFWIFASFTYRILATDFWKCSYLAFNRNDAVHKFLSCLTSFFFSRNTLCPLLVAYFKYDIYLLLEFLISRQKSPF
jgi:hypothetical protein